MARKKKRGLRKLTDKGTTKQGYKNKKKQINLGRIEPPRPRNDYNQYIYVMKCMKCRCIYGSNGSDIHERKCPRHQGGAKGPNLSEKIIKAFSNRL